MTNSPDMVHYLLTRFNIVNKGTTQYALQQRGTKVQTDEWTRKRFHLFEQFCLPSVAAQSCTAFRWLVLFDEGTPQFYKNLIANYAKQCPMFTPLFLAPETDEVAYVRDYILSDTEASHIITTRIDNDDAIHSHYIQLIQQHFITGETNLFLIYRFGLQYSTRHHICQRFADDLNHFMSRIETRDNLQTVWVKDDRHDLADNYGDIKQIPVPSTQANTLSRYYPMWIEVVHDSNVTNNFRLTSASRPHWLDKSSFNIRIPQSIPLYIIMRLLHIGHSVLKQCTH